jgi:hypothetical protein
LAAVEAQPPQVHPEVKRIEPLEWGQRDVLYLKIYFCLNAFDKIKDWLRDSNALRAWKQSQFLVREGFRVPPVVAAGEERSGGVLKRAFLLTRRVEGLPVSLFLAQLEGSARDAQRIREKRFYLRRLATEIRRLRDRGFVHGDLTPHNLLAHREGGNIVFVFMDNDRTRRYPVWFPQWLWRRNLIQLNRVKLPGISLQDRVRFLRFYLAEESRSPKEVRLLRWLERKTRKRRAWKDRFRGEVSFRELMRWDGQFEKKRKRT